MTAIYTWSSHEIMLAERIKDIQRDVETDRLIQEAGRSRLGVYERATTAFGCALVRLGQYLQMKYAHSHQVSSTTSGKYAV